MRQHNFVFDVDNNLVGIARATCNEDSNQVKHEEELVLAHQNLQISGLWAGKDFTKRQPREQHDSDPQPHVDFDPDKEPEVGP